ncbi:MAG: hypothetical protein ACREEM_09585 [Blastocatellia bacterium]
MAALRSRLSCYALSFAPVRLSNGVSLSPNSTLDNLFDQAGIAATRGTAADLMALTPILDLLNSNDPTGRCN